MLFLPYFVDPHTDPIIIGYIKDCKIIWPHLQILTFGGDGDGCAIADEVGVTIGKRGVGVTSHDLVKDC